MKQLLYWRKTAINNFLESALRVLILAFIWLAAANAAAAIAATVSGNRALIDSVQPSFRMAFASIIMSFIAACAVGQMVADRNGVNRLVIRALWLMFALGIPLWIWRVVEVFGWNLVFFWRHLKNPREVIFALASLKKKPGIFLLSLPTKTRKQIAVWWSAICK